MLPAMQSSGKIIPLTHLFWPWHITRQLSRHGLLIREFTKRSILARYRGSYLGILWSLLRPLMMLGIYTLVFGHIFESKLGNTPDESKLDFTLALFCGLILFEFFGECVGSAPSLVVEHPNYVKKVVFPLEILPVAAVGAALIQLIISFVPLFIALALVHGTIPLTACYLPVIVLPLILLSLGLCWLLASLGVFIRDIKSLVPMLLMILMFGSAIFYSIKSIPPRLLPYFQLNPLAVVIDQARNAVLWGVPPAWAPYGMLLAVGLIVMMAGYAFFMRTKRAFADVI